MSLDFGLIFYNMMDLLPSVVIYYKNIARLLQPWEEIETLKFHSFEMMGLVKAEMLHS